jgi:orotidine-5'-phosphate decarboxylase
VDRLVIALDVERGARARALAAWLRGVAGGYKVGSRLFTAEGPAIVRALVEDGHRVFLDLKFHDIPQTVADAVAAAASLGVWMVDVHATGGLAMMQAAKAAAIDAAARSGFPPPLVVAVTVLTSLTGEALGEVGFARPVRESVVHLARLAQRAGLDGVVASPQEIADVRAACGDRFTIVTPGIRGGAAAAGTDDQARTLTPAAAVAAGADYIVVGRPVLAAPDPRAAAEAIARELATVAPPRRGARPDSRPVVTLFTRRQCHLCEEMEAVVRAVVAEQSVRLETVDVDADPALAARFGRDVPVLWLDGREIARHRITPQALRTHLEAGRTGRQPS